MRLKKINNLISVIFRLLIVYHTGYLWSVQFNCHIIITTTYWLFGGNYNLLDNYLHNYLSIYRKKKQSVKIIVIVWPKEEEKKIRKHVELPSKIKDQPVQFQWKFKPIFCCFIFKS